MRLNYGVVVMLHERVNNYITVVAKREKGAFGFPSITVGKLTNWPFFSTEMTLALNQVDMPLR